MNATIPSSSGCMDGLHASIAISIFGAQFVDAERSSDVCYLNLFQYFAVIIFVWRRVSG